MLVIGGGDGGTVREILKHTSVRRVVLAEIDALVVDACRAHMPTLSAGAFDDARVELRIGDAFEYLAACDARFDIIIVDLCDPTGPATSLYNERSYALQKAALKPRGIVAFQGARQVRLTIG